MIISASSPTISVRELAKELGVKAEKLLPLVKEIAPEEALAGMQAGIRMTLTWKTVRALCESQGYELDGVKYNYIIYRDPEIQLTKDIK